MNAKELLKPVGRWVGRNAVLAVLMTLGILYGQGCFMKPDVVVPSAVEVDLRIPVALRMEIMLARLSSTRGELQQEFRDELESNLLGSGMTQDRAAQIAQEVGEDEAAECQLLGLSDREDAIVEVAAKKAMSSIVGTAFDTMLDLPASVISFEVKNVGRTAAKNAHLKLHVRRQVLDFRVYSENKWVQTGSGSGPFELDLGNFAPGSSLRGVVWCGGAPPLQPAEGEVVNAIWPDAGQITLVHDGGTIREEISLIPLFSEQ